MKKCIYCEKEFEEYIIENETKKAYVPCGPDDYNEEMEETIYKFCPYCNRILESESHPF